MALAQLERIDAQDRRVARWTVTHLPVVFGRGHGADVLLEDPHVAACHALLLQDEQGGFVIEDAGTLNKVRIDGRPVDRAPLASGTIFELGLQRFRLRLAIDDVPPERLLDLSLGVHAQDPADWSRTVLALTAVSVLAYHAIDLFWLRSATWTRTGILTLSLHALQALLAPSLLATAAMALAYAYDLRWRPRAHLSLGLIHSLLPSSLSALQALLSSSFAGGVPAALGSLPVGVGSGALALAAHAVVMLRVRQHAIGLVAGAAMVSAVAWVWAANVPTVVPTEPITDALPLEPWSPAPSIDEAFRQLAPPLLKAPE